jgi:hypothetical protein
MLLTESRRTVTTSTASMLFVAVLAVHAAVALLVGMRGWDDGSITVAFARTFADTGRIALTPLSEVVEGYSSPFWMALLAATYRVLPLGFDGMVLASQLWAGLFAALGAVLLHRLLRPFLGRSAVVLSFVVFVSTAFLNETANGMEMTALSAATLAVLWALRTRRNMPVLFALAALIPWIRLEASGYVIAGAVLIALVTRDRRRGGALIVGVLASALLLTALRYAVFDSVLPNTMLAKQSPPYPYGTSLADRVAMSKTVVKELLLVVTPGLIVGAGAVLGRRFPALPNPLARLRARTVSPAIAFAVGYLAGVVGANLVLGPNWGYLGRMEQSLVALAVVTVVFCLPRAMRALESPMRLVCVVVAMLAIACYGVDGERVDAVLEPGRADAITPAAYRDSAQAVDVVRRALGAEQFSLMTPDVGGASLCCTNFEILDSGLLTNRELARNGYEALGPYLASHRPDAIITHSVWSSASDVYSLPQFRTAYSPVTASGTWFYVRNDLLARLSESCSSVAVADTTSFRYRGDDVDESYIRSLGKTDVCRVD